MPSRSSALAALAASALVAALPGGSTRAADQSTRTTTQPVASAIRVGPNVQVSRGRESFSHYELLAGAHTSDPNKLMACSMMVSPEQNASNSIVYTSLDGGKTWKETFEAHVGDLTGDPVCEYGIGDNAYFVALTTRDPSKVLVYRSTDAGTTWSSAPTEFPFIDREALAVDMSGGKYQGRIYINGTASVRGIESGSKSAVSLFRSTDGGATFQGPVLRAAVDAQHVVGMGNTVVLSDGTVVTLFGHQRNTATSDGRSNRPGAPNSWLRVVTSEDGGETLSTGVVVSDWYMDRERSPASHIPWLAVDRSSRFKDRLYAVWNDARSGRLEVLLAYSSDKGKTWSKPVVVGDDRIAPDPADGPDQIMPLVAVNKDGVAAVAWYDRREHKDNLGWWLRVSASLDGGETFLPSVRVSDAPNNFGGRERWPVRASVSGGGEPVRAGAQPAPAGRPLSVRVGVDGFFFSPGHTSGFVADAGGVFHPIWTDNRTGISQLWTAPVTVQGQVYRNGSKDLAELDDVSANVTLQVSATNYDRATNAASMFARLKNTSKQVVRGPLKARVVALQSDVGVPSIVNAANGERGVGAVWDFTPLIKGGELKPDELSEPKELQFRLADLRSLRQGGRSRFGLISFDVRILGGAVRKTDTTAQ